MSEADAALRDARDRTARLIEELSGAFDQIVGSSEFADLDDEHDPKGATVASERAQIAELLERARARLAEIDAPLRRFEGGAPSS